ncbi:MAG: hypothetical protein OEZ68_02440 [Gammaproteobacteria bacterium]|nr:hypothetical protein [Gammaproteobacteria bacterium]MDH5799641.1 hypothetical protein [Gammaproteobacteria bacterium]
MSNIDIVNIEIEEAYNSVSHQHQQIKFYLQYYMVALIGLFTLTGYLTQSNNEKTEDSPHIEFHFAMFPLNSVQNQLSEKTDESKVIKNEMSPSAKLGITFVVTVFLLGWAFIAILAHKISFLVLLYKHIAFFRYERLELGGSESMKAGYVLPNNKSHIKLPSLVIYLPYVFFVFNYLILIGGLSYYLILSLDWVQTIAVVSFVSIVFGIYYPIVCLTFNKHYRAARKAPNMAGKLKLIMAWNQLVKGNSTGDKEDKAEEEKIRELLNKRGKAIALAIFTSVSGVLAMGSFYVKGPDNIFEVVDNETLYAVVVLVFTAIYCVIRFFMEHREIKLNRKYIKAKKI